MRDNERPRIKFYNNAAKRIYYWFIIFYSNNRVKWKKIWTLKYLSGSMKDAEK